MAQDVEGWSLGLSYRRRVAGRRGKGGSFEKGFDSHF